MSLLKPLARAELLVLGQPPEHGGSGGGTLARTPLLAAMGVGLAQAAFDDALAYAREREAFGSPIGKYQSIRHRLSEMATDIAAARLDL